MKSKKARFFKGDIIRSKSYKTYKVEEIHYDGHGNRIIVAFPHGFTGIGVRFFDSDENYFLVR